jgi:HSP20 family protein
MGTAGTPRNADVVDVDLPNVSPDEVNIERRGEQLRISGTFQERDRGGVLRRQNRETGEFEYLVDLPSGLDAGQVDALYDNGVRTITVPEAKDSLPRRIEVHGKR